MEPNFDFTVFICCEIVHKWQNFIFCCKTDVFKNCTIAIY